MRLVITVLAILFCNLIISQSTYDQYLTLLNDSKSSLESRSGSLLQRKIVSYFFIFKEAYKGKITDNSSVYISGDRNEKKLINKGTSISIVGTEALFGDYLLKIEGDTNLYNLPSYNYRELKIKDQNKFEQHLKIINDLISSQEYKDFDYLSNLINCYFLTDKTDPFENVELKTVVARAKSRTYESLSIRVLFRKINKSIFLDFDLFSNKEYLAGEGCAIKDQSYVYFKAENDEKLKKIHIADTSCDYGFTIDISDDLDYFLNNSIDIIRFNTSESFHDIEMDQKSKDFIMLKLYCLK